MTDPKSWVSAQAAAAPRKPAPLSRRERAHLRKHSILLPREGTSGAERTPCKVNPRLCLYVRISMLTANSVSIARQIEVLEAEVKRLGGIYNREVDLYIDQDLSAKGTVYRPAAEALLRAVQDERYDGVLIFEYARFMRDVRQSQIATLIMRDHGCELYSLREPGLSVFGWGRFMVDFAAESAQKEIEALSERAASARRYTVMAGAHIYGAVPFGMCRVPTDIVIEGRTDVVYALAPDEQPRPEYDSWSPAEIIRRCAAMYIAGSTFAELRRWLNAQSWPALRSPTWREITIKRLLLSPVLRGYAVADGQIVIVDGEPFRPHVPLITDDLAEQIDHARLKRKVHHRAANDTRLRGLLHCYSCGRVLKHGNGARKNAPSVQYYRCPGSPDGPYVRSCPGSSIAARPAEAYVYAAVRAVLTDPDRLAQIRRGAAPSPLGNVDLDAIQTDIERCRDALRRLEKNHAAGAYDDEDGKARYDEVKADLLADHKGATDILRRHQSHSTRAGLDRQDLNPRTTAKAWDTASAADKLDIARELIDHIDIGRGPTRGGNPKPFDPTRIAIVWRDHADT